MGAAGRWIAALLLLCAAASAHAREPLRVLFVGNSYTYTHELPQLVAALARAHGTELHVEMRAEADFGLFDHLRDPKLRPLVVQRWDWIVLQQGPSSLPESRRSLVEATREFHRRAGRSARALTRAANSRAPLSTTTLRSRDVREARDLRDAPTLRENLDATPTEIAPARIAMLSVWPPRPHADRSPEGEQSYRIAAATVGGCVLPVAAAWRIARESGDAPTLYQRDELHPTRAGSVLAAITILPSLLRLDSKAKLLAAPPDATEDERARLARLEQAAREARAQEPRLCQPIVVR
jgi:hypothetical protein